MSFIGIESFAKACGKGRRFFSDIEMCRFSEGAAAEYNFSLAAFFRI